MASGSPNTPPRPRSLTSTLRRAPDREPPPTFGEALRQARVSRRLSLEDVERETRIPVRYLAALEEQEYGALPSSVYARGVLRAYAQHLDLDPTPLLDAYRPPRVREERTAFRPTVSLGGGGLPFSWSWLVGLLLLAGGIWLAVYLYGQYVALSETLAVPERPRPNNGLDIPEPLVAPWTPLPRTPLPLLALAGPESADATATPGPPADAAITPTAGTPLPGAPAAGTPGTGTPGTGTPGTGTPAPSPTVAPTATPQPTARPSAPLTVEARVAERSWVQVWADGRQVFAETLAPGATRTFTANDSVQMRVSNAGGVNVTVNGEPQGRLGTSGQAVDVTWGRR
jgi:cytoskeletal protein RodZ